ncbi:PLP-dependent aminotransferase family protein [Parafilimonas sp.]|uniref:aminotransferase-like domain-containing protein n=1 Tax=Parafilimonas sp. TaxID=1969739 RepID=UPI003F7FF441
MDIFKSLLQIDRTGSRTISLQLSNGILGLIQRGYIQPKDRVPSVRKMAEALKIHPKTVVAAYEDLVAQNWLETVPRKGIYVSSVLPVIQPVQPFSKDQKPDKGRLYKSSADVMVTTRNSIPQILIDDGFPDNRLAPWEIIMRDYRRLKTKKHAIQASIYGDPAGCEIFRSELSRYLRETRAIPVGPEQLCITRGAQMALYLLCRILVKNGAKVIVADPNYTLANNVLEECGAMLIHVPVEQDGIDVAKIAEICNKEKIDGIYIIPHHHHPTTACLSPQKRIALLDICEEHKLFIIEDDYDYDYHYDSSPVLPLASFAKSSSIFYIGSLSKVISNSLRLGFIFCKADIKHEVVRLRRLIDLRGDTFLELAMAEFFRNGDIERHLKRTTKIYKERRDLMYNWLNGELGNYLSVQKPKGGMAFWVKFDDCIDLPGLSEKAIRKGLGISNGFFYNRHVNLNSIRMGFASKNLSEIDQCGGILVSLLKKT